MSKLLFLTYTFGGAATVVGGYYGYSLWRTSNIQKVKEFKDAVTDYENRQDRKKVHDYLKNQVCLKEEYKKQEATDWCGKIKDTDSVKELIQGLTRVSDRNKPYEKMVAEVAGRVPLENNELSRK